jgi:hypothetical protein
MSLVTELVNHHYHSQFSSSVTDSALGYVLSQCHNHEQVHSTLIITKTYQIAFMFNAK